MAQLEITGVDCSINPKIQMISDNSNPIFFQSKQLSQSLLAFNNVLALFQFPTALVKLQKIVYCASQN